MSALHEAVFTILWGLLLMLVPVPRNVDWVMSQYEKLGLVSGNKDRFLRVNVFVARLVGAVLLVGGAVGLVKALLVR